MNERTPYAAGLFYSRHEEGLRRDVEKLLNATGDANKGILALGVVVPHAGYDYSGSVAGSVFNSIEIPSRLIILGPNHSGFGFPVSIDAEGSWKTPLGEVGIDEALASDLLSRSQYIKVSPEAHRLEHSIEVQLPFLQVVKDAKFSFVPITMKGLEDVGVYQEVGQAIAETIKSPSDKVLVIASSDFTHYESLAVAETMDRLAIDAILALDPDLLLKTVYENDISMCGVGPVATMLYAAKELGATKAELIKYTTSADFSMDASSVVGYGGLVVT